MLESGTANHETNVLGKDFFSFSSFPSHYIFSLLFSIPVPSLLCLFPSTSLLCHEVVPLSLTIGGSELGSSNALKWVGIPQQVRAPGASPSESA